MTALVSMFVSKCQPGEALDGADHLRGAGIFVEDKRKVIPISSSR